MFNLIEQALGEEVRTLLASTVSGARMRNPIHIKSINGTIGLVVLGSMKFIVLADETVGKLLNCAVCKSCYRNFYEA